MDKINEGSCIFIFLPQKISWPIVHFFFLSKEISRWILCVVAEKERSEELWQIFFFFYLLFVGVWEEH